jgi:hypothetical protein
MKTAIEWLYNELSKNNTSTDSAIEKINKESSIWEQAKKIEKDQILDARLDGFVISGEGWNGEYPFEGKTYEEISLKINNEEYYKITYDQSE